MLNAPKNIHFHPFKHQKIAVFNPSNTNVRFRVVFEQKLIKGALSIEALLKRPHLLQRFHVRQVGQQMLAQALHNNILATPTVSRNMHNTLHIAQHIAQHQSDCTTHCTTPITLHIISILLCCTFNESMIRAASTSAARTICFSPASRCANADILRFSSCR